MKTDNLDIRNMDCMELMREFPDNHFDLAVVDPPYGLGISNHDTLGNKKVVAKNSFLKKPIKPKIYKTSEWDSEAPKKEYFDELKRVSKRQVIWGANYFDGMGLNGGRLFWDKMGTGNYSRGEIAYLSFVNRVEYHQFRWAGMLQGDMKDKESRIHPTQKPIKLYDWIFANYAEKGMEILDTHMGSGSIAIAAHYAGMHLTASELDEDYYREACERIERETQQTTMF